jgi:serine/threonine protein kinase
VLSGREGFAQTLVGTPYYLSPELIEDRPYREKSDVWCGPAPPRRAPTSPLLPPAWQSCPVPPPTQLLEQQRQRQRRQRQPGSTRQRGPRRHRASRCGHTRRAACRALGVCLYECCAQAHPFDANNQGALLLKILRGRYPPLPSTYSRELRELVKSCLTQVGGYKGGLRIEEGGGEGCGGGGVRD